MYIIERCQFNGRHVQTTEHQLLTEGWGTLQYRPTMLDLAMQFLPLLTACLPVIK